MPRIMENYLPKFMEKYLPVTANQNRLSKWKEMYGGEVVDMAVSMNIDGDHYYLFLQAISYDNDKWYVFNTHGMLASLLGLDANSGGLCLTSEPGAN